MDAAYDCSEIPQYAKASGQVAIIDPNPRRDRARKARLAAEAKALKQIGQIDPAKVRFQQRSSPIFNKISLRTVGFWYFSDVQNIVIV